MDKLQKKDGAEAAALVAETAAGTWSAGVTFTRLAHTELEGPQLFHSATEARRWITSVAEGRGFGDDDVAIEVEARGTEV